MFAPLYAFQKDAVERIAAGEQVYLGFDPGLGKSRTALEAAQRRRARRVLVICPASGRYVWDRQVRLWSQYPVTIARTPSDLAKGGVVVLTYGLISKRPSPCVDAVVSGKPWDMTVLDEAAAVKNPGSNRARAILGPMFAKLGYVLPLSGTPAPNHAGELYSILRALWPRALVNGSSGALTPWQFEDHFCVVEQKRFTLGGPLVRVISGSKNIPELRRKLEGFMLRVRKEMVLKDLPAIRYDIVPLGIDPLRAAQLPSAPRIDNDDDFMTYLRAASTQEHTMRLRRLLGNAKLVPAIEYIDDFVSGLPDGKKVLVFAHHREVIDGLMSGLADWNPVKIDGGSTPAERAVAIDLFLTIPNRRIFVGNILAAGTALTLVGPTCRCSDVIFVEASYSVGDNVQAAARVHRIGQSAAVVARFLTAHGTIDDRINDILARKAKDFQALFN